MVDKIETTVVGSYPVNIDKSSLIDSYFKQKKYPWGEIISQATQDQIIAGIDVVSDGQTRDPFVNIFLRKLQGCRIRARPEIIDKIEYKGPIIIEDQKYLRRLIPKDKKIIAPLAGPFTLTKSVINSYYSDEKELVFDFAKALSKEVKELEKHVDIISIDEPFFSIEMPEYANELIRTISKNITIPTRLHSCGNVSKIVSELCDLPVDILSHEFKATPELFDAFAEYTCSKKICLGSVRSDNDKIESISEITNHIKQGLDVFGEKIVQISPDCGLRFLPRKIAFEKLKNLVKAGEVINGR
jgi:5-methyltetrahydropteroyltriglutamate--homocysteine methyltransferase